MTIPTSARETLHEREQGRCLRCAGRATDWAHRRTRAVHDEHTNCPCNGCYLCHTCHMWCHRNPREATEKGFIVSRYEESPRTIPVDTWYGRLLLLCDGNVSFDLHTVKEEKHE